MNESVNLKQGDAKGNKPREDASIALTEASPVPALELLRDRIVHAAEEITRLRTVNSDLAERVNRLEAVHGISAGSSSFVIDEDPEELKEKISGYIKTIDAYLEEIDEGQPESE